MAIICVSCGSQKSKTWWKCCPEHTTEKELDVVCETCAGCCIVSKNSLVEQMPDTTIDPRVVQRLKSGDWSFGHSGRHVGNGTEDCPRIPHHHHDEFCSLPTPAELRAAGIKLKDFKARSRV